MLLSTFMYLKFEIDKTVKKKKAEQECSFKAQ